MMQGPGIGTGSLRGRSVLIFLLLGCILAGCQKTAMVMRKGDLGVEILARDAVWKARKSPYRLDRSLMILPEATLTLEPGVEVLLAPDVSIFCHGRILAEGDPDRPIRFAPAGEAPWDKIDCFGGKQAASGEVPTNVFRHCIVEGGRGVQARAGDLVMERCTLRGNVDTPVSLEFSAGRIVGNRIHGNSTEREAASGNGGGIVVYTDKKAVFAENEAFDNVSVGGRDGGGGIYAYAYDRGEVDVLRNTVRGNRSDRHGGGLVAFGCRVEGNRVIGNAADDSGGGVFAVDAEILDNRVEGNRAGRGGGIYAERCRIERNTVAHNAAPAGHGAGLFFYGEGRIRANTFYGNGAGNGAPGESVLVSGGPVLRANNFVAGKGHALRVQTHRLAPDLDATDNFWGVRYPGAVLGRIHDWLDDADLGIVDWSRPRPRWATEAPPPPPGFLLARAEGEAWGLRWEFPEAVPISGFRLFVSAGPDFEGVEPVALGASLRAFRDRRPLAGPFLCRLQAVGVDPNGREVASGLSEVVRVPEAGTPPVVLPTLVPVGPQGCDGPPGVAPVFRAGPVKDGQAPAMARWLVSELPLDFSSPVFDSGPVDAADALPLPGDVLQPGREYAWRVAFQGAGGGWTDWSPASRFCTPPPDERTLAGPILADRVLGAEGKAPYRVTGNLFVPADVSVSIRPGTVLRFAPDTTLRVRGTLTAGGEPGARIRFTGAPDRPWGNLFFEPGTRSAAAGDEPGEPAERGLLRHCVVEHGTGILMEETGPRVEGCLIRRNRGSGISVRNASVRITRNRILENHSPTNGGGIYAYGSKLLYIEGNEIRDNQAREDGGGVFGYGYRSNTAVNLSGNRIEGNQCEGDGGGVWASRASVLDNEVLSNEAPGKGGGLFVTFALVRGNRIRGNAAGEGGGVFAETNSSLEDNRIEANRCTGPHGGGVYMNFWGMSIKNEVFRGNRVTGNRAAGEDGDGGVYLNGSMVFEYNRIHDNRGSQLHNANPAGRQPLSAPHCYWGASDTAGVERAIRHGADDPALARVLFEPFAPSPAAAVPPR